jgi:hypothetical protein
MGRLESTLPLPLLTPSPQSFKVSTNVLHSFMIVVQRYCIFVYLPTKLRFYYKPIFRCFKAFISVVWLVYQSLREMPLKRLILRPNGI